MVCDGRGIRQDQTLHAPPTDKLESDMATQRRADQREAHPREMVELLFRHPNVGEVAMVDLPNGK